ncbi:metallophosphoesterase [Paenibacillus sp. CMAA1364]
MMDKKITRRQFLRACGATLLGGGMLVGGYAWLWEPKHLTIEYIELNFSTFPSSFNGLKIVQFSDVHLGFHFDERSIKNLMEAISSQLPDMICFTGDMVDYDSDAMRNAIPDLSSLHAPLGKYAVLGNHDHWGQPNEVRRMLEEAGFTVLHNSHVILTREHSSLAIVGLEDVLHGMPDPQKALKGIPEDTFSILMVHEPDYADIASSFPFNLQLSGHSHGGQVRFPFVGSITTPIGSKRYIQGLYHLDNSDLLLYVNRGVGVTKLPIRFLCAPEITVFNLNNSGE